MAAAGLPGVEPLRHVLVLVAAHHSVGLAQVPGQYNKLCLNLMACVRSPRLVAITTMMRRQSACKSSSSFIAQGTHRLSLCSAHCSPTYTTAITRTKQARVAVHAWLSERAIRLTQNCREHAGASSDIHCPPSPH